MKRTLAALMCLICTAGAARAQTPPVRLTLPEAVARGLDSSHRLAELLAREEAARAVEGQRQAATQPQLTVNANLIRTNHVEEFGVPNGLGGVRIIYPDIPNNVRSRIDLQWPIYTGGRLQALIKAAGEETGATSQDRQAGRADLKLEITRAYWAVVTARAAQVVVMQSLERTNAHLADVRQQLAVGLVPPSDVLSIEAQQAREQLLSIEAENLITSASAEFRKLAGLEPETPFDLADVPPTVDAEQPGVADNRSTPQSLGEAIEAARANRPERKALQFRINAATERVEAAAAGHLPVLTAVGGYDLARPNPRIFPIQGEWKPSWDLSLNIRWALFEGGRTRAETAEAAANQRMVEARLREFDSTVDVEVRQRTADLRSARASIAAARTGVRAAAEARRMLGERFSAGVATNTDVLTAQAALLQAELDLTRAMANAHMAEARLDRAMGR